MYTLSELENIIFQCIAGWEIPLRKSLALMLLTLRVTALKGVYLDVYNTWPEILGWEHHRLSAEDGWDVPSGPFQP